ncbi:MAG: hypothetical protein P8I91_03595 [Phycisphaerales bacterium]|nr:hypothetical protein [Phycisphaerales bacterium]
MRQTSIRSLIGVVTVASAFCGMASMVSCGSNWRMHESQVISAAKPAAQEAPAWVQGKLPLTEDRIFFIGRSHTPDDHRGHLTDGEWGTSQHRRTPNKRVGYTVLDERDLVQSARNDVYDQIRQRLSPRSFGTTGQTLTMTVDVGNCMDCGDPLPELARMPVQPSCNEPCLRHSNTTWPNSASNNRCGSCTSTAVQGGVPVVFADNCGTCDNRHAFQSQAKSGCSSCPTEISSSSYPWNQSYWPHYSNIQGRDLSTVNIGVDSVMPAMLANVMEEELHFEKWHVHEGGDSGNRPFAEGRDEWQSYKCWMLCSIPRAEYELIVNEFRSTYRTMLAQGMSRNQDDRARRVDWETRMQDTEMRRRNRESSGEVLYDYYDIPRR